MFALISLSPFNVVEKFRDLRREIVLPNGDRLIGAQVGWTNGEHKVVDVVMTGTRPTPLHQPSDGRRTLTGNTLTIERNWAAPPLAESKAHIIVMVKQEAQDRITTYAAEWKQRDTLAEMLTLLETRKINFSPSDQAKWDAGKTLWNQINAIRAASNTIESNVNAASTVEDAWLAFANGVWP